MRGKTNALIGGGGGGSTPTEEVTVQAVEFPTVVEPRSGYALSKATVTAPDNLEAGNIKSGVSIAGVTGTYEGSGEPIVDPVAEKFRAIAKGEGADIDITWDDITSWIGTPVQNKTTYLISYKEINSIEINLDELVPNFINNILLKIPLTDMYIHGEYTYTTPAFYNGYVNLSFGFEESTTIGAIFSNYYFTDDIVIPEGITSMISTFNSCAKHNGSAASSLTITTPSTLTSISGTYTLCGSYGNGMNIIMKATTPPTLSSASALSRTGSTASRYLSSITVPAGCLEAYQTATNWTTWADFMVEATE